MCLFRSYLQKKRNAGAVPAQHRGTEDDGNNKGSSKCAKIVLDHKKATARTKQEEQEARAHNAKTKENADAPPPLHDFPRVRLVLFDAGVNAGEAHVVVNVEVKQGPRLA